MKGRFSFRKEATRITVVYLLFGLAWILFSDGFVHLFPVDEDTLYKINIVKGWTYVFVTAGLVYYLISRYLQKISQTMDLLQQKEMLLLSLLDSIPDLIFYKDTDGVYMGCNTAFERFVGKPCSQIIGSTDKYLFSKEVSDSFREMDEAMLRQKQERKNEEQVTYPDGHKVYLETLKTPYYDKEGNVLGLIGVSRDISERKNKELEILYLNNTDVLTGLYNRRYFEKEKKQ
ncbi:MAG: PAS domain-containing protein, partial [Eubacteriales bacterium]|nr:PAS domain-containing protein [Eubacteriales bacterium]